MLTPVWNFRHLVQLVVEALLLLEAFETLNSPCSGEPPVHRPCPVFTRQVLCRVQQAMHCTGTPRQRVQHLYHTLIDLHSYQDAGPGRGRRVLGSNNDRALMTELQMAVGTWRKV